LLLEKYGHPHESEVRLPQLKLTSCKTAAKVNILHSVISYSTAVAVNIHASTLEIVQPCNIPLQSQQKAFGKSTVVKQQGEAHYSTGFLFLHIAHNKYCYSSICTIIKLHFLFFFI
jgi:hypothetical protein